MNNNSMSSTDVFLNTTSFYPSPQINPFSTTVTSTTFSWIYFGISMTFLLCIVLYVIKLTKSKAEYKGKTFSLLLSMKSVLLLPLEHITDMTTDIAVAIYWTQLSLYEDDCDCGPYFKYLNMGRMMMCCLCIHFLYRISSAFTIYRAIDALNECAYLDNVHSDINWHAMFRATMQGLFDSEILIATYHNLKIDHTQTTSILRVIRSFEGNTEAFWQSVLQLVFALRTSTEYGFNFTVLFSLFWSMKSTLFAWYNFDKCIMIQDASESNFEMKSCAGSPTEEEEGSNKCKKCKYPNIKSINHKFAKRMIWRTCNVVGRVCLIAYIYVVAGFQAAFVLAGLSCWVYTFIFTGKSFGYMGFQFFVGVFLFPPDYSIKHTLCKMCCSTSMFAACRFVENLFLFCCVVWLSCFEKEDIEDPFIGSLPFEMRSEAVNGTIAQQVLFAVMFICLVLDCYLFYKWKISSFVVGSAEDMPHQITLNVYNALERKDDEDYEFLKKYIGLKEEDIKQQKPKIDRIEAVRKRIDDEHLQQFKMTMSPQAALY